MFNEHFGQGSASYDYVAHEMPHHEFIAWWAYFTRHAELDTARKEQVEHDDLMKRAAKATHG